MDRTILILTEYFGRGGLETSIVGEARTLQSLGVNVCLATGSNGDHIPHEVFSAALTDLKMGPSVTFADLRRCLDTLKQFARAHGVTAIHSHPFHSLAVGFLAAAELNLPLVVTLHGPASVEELTAPVARRIFRSGVLRSARHVLCVSPETMLKCRAAGGSPSLLRNTATIGPRREMPVDRLGPWMWAGRIDAPKSVGLLDLCAKLRGAGRELHVFGDGPAKQSLEATLAADPSLSFVSLHGWRHDLETIYADYAVVAGMGRVVIEAAAQGIPCLLVGYDGVKAFLCADTVESASFANFSGRGLETMSIVNFQSTLQHLEHDPAPYDIYDWIKAEHDETTHWTRFLGLIGTPHARSSAFARDCLDVVRRAADPQALAWSDQGIAELLTRLSGMSEDADLDGLRAELSEAHNSLRFELEQERQRAATALEAERAHFAGALAEQRGRYEAELAAHRDLLSAQRTEAATRHAELLAQRATAEAERNAQAEMLHHEREALHHEREALAATKDELESLRDSTSWRITAPLRTVATAAKRHTKKDPKQRNN